MKQLEKERRNVLVHWGFDPDKPVTNMSLGELYSLMKFAINRKNCSS